MLLLSVLLEVTLTVCQICDLLLFCEVKSWLTFTCLFQGGDLT